MPIFLSYSRDDLAAVKLLAQALHTARRETWFDHELDGGDAWWDTICETIRLAPAFVFALSDASLGSKACRSELDYAEKLGRPIVPIQVGPVRHFLSNPLADRQILLWRPDDAMSGFEIVAAVDEAIRKSPPLPVPLPDPPPMPHAYLLALGRQIDSSELSQTQQLAVVDQLRRALREESEAEILDTIRSMLLRLSDKSWSTKLTEHEVRLALAGPRWPPEDEPAEPTAIGPEPADPVQPDMPGEPPATAVRPAGPAFDPRDDFLSRFGGPQAEAAAPPPPRASWPAASAPEPLPARTTESADSPPVATTVADRPVRPATLPAKPNPGWVLSALALVSLVFGIVALYFSAQVGRRWSAGDPAGARQAASYARIWAVVGLVLFGISFIFSAVYGSSN